LRQIFDTPYRRLLFNPITTAASADDVSIQTRLPPPPLCSVTQAHVETWDAPYHPPEYAAEPCPLCGRRYDDSDHKQKRNERWRMTLSETWCITPPPVTTATTITTTYGQNRKRPRHSLTESSSTPTPALALSLLVSPAGWAADHTRPPPSCTKEDNNARYTLDHVCLPCLNSVTWAALVYNRLVYHTYPTTSDHYGQEMTLYEDDVTHLISACDCYWVSKQSRTRHTSDPIVICPRCLPRVNLPLCSPWVVRVLRDCLMAPWPRTTLLPVSPLLDLIASYVGPQKQVV
jgi:hypothetical protein